MLEVESIHRVKAMYDEIGIEVLLRICQMLGLHSFLKL